MKDYIECPKCNKRLEVSVDDKDLYDGIGDIDCKYCGCEVSYLVEKTITDIWEDEE